MNYTNLINHLENFIKTSKTSEFTNLVKEYISFLLEREKEEFDLTGYSELNEIGLQAYRNKKVKIIFNDLIRKNGKNSVFINHINIQELF